MPLTKKDLVKVRGLLYDVRRKWYDIGLELGIPATELDNIKIQYHNDLDDCLREVVRMWLKSCDIPPTWQALANALQAKAVNEKALAAQGNVRSAGVRWG